MGTITKMKLNNEYGKAVQRMDAMKKEYNKAFVVKRKNDMAFDIQKKVLIEMEGEGYAQLSKQLQKLFYEDCKRSTRKLAILYATADIERLCDDETKRIIHNYLLSIIRERLATIDSAQLEQLLPAANEENLKRGLDTQNPELNLLLFCGLLADMAKEM